MSNSIFKLFGIKTPPIPLGYRLLFLVVCLAGCVENNSKLIAEKVNERVEDFKKKKQEECRQNLLTKAEKMVDSLLLNEAQQSLLDSLSKLKPFRPTQPPSVPAIDSLKVQPIFDGSPKQ